MKSPPPPPVDRIERTVNPVALAILLVCLAGALLAVWLAPSAVGATLMTWMIVILAVCGAFGLLLYAFGMLQLPTRAARFDTTKAIADSNPDGVLVTDRESRIVYANDAYRALSGAAAASDLRPIERLFTGSPDVSESVYRLSQAAKSGARASEELRLSPPPSGQGEVAWYRIRVRPLEGVARDGMMVWTVSDETRDHDRHETFFQDLQHAIDYLDHAPAGFFSAEPDGSIAHMNATLAGWLDYDLAQFSAGRLKIDDIVAGDGGAMLAIISGPPGEVTTQQFDVDLKPRQGRLLPVRILHKVAFSGDGAPGPSRSLVINRAPGDIKGEDLRAAEVRFARIFNSTPVAIAAVDAAGAVLRPNAAFARLAQAASKSDAAKGRLSIFDLVAERDRAPLSASIEAAAQGKGEIAPLDVSLEGAGAAAFGAALRLGRRSAQRRGRERDHLRPRHHRAAHPAREPRAKPEDAGHRPARRRRRARLQQRADRDHRLFRSPARQSPPDRPVLPGHHADQAERQSGGGARAAIARLFAPSDAAPPDAAAQRRAVGIADAAAPAGRRDRSSSTSSTGATCGR